MCPVNRLLRSGVVAMLVLLIACVVVAAQPGTAPEPPRAHLGVLLGPADEGASGIVVQEVTPDSPAAKAGLKKGDRIVKLDDQEIQNAETFFGAVKPKKPGDKVKLGFVRDGKEQTLTATLAERPAPGAPGLPGLPGPARRPAFLGVHTQPLTPDLKKRLNVEVESGAVVTAIVPNSPAAKAGLKRDDVISDVDDKPMKAPQDLRDAIQKAGPGKELAIGVIRGKEKLTVKAKLREGTARDFLPSEEAWDKAAGGDVIRDQSRRIRELERRIEELEKRLRTLEKK